MIDGGKRYWHDPSLKGDELARELWGAVKEIIEEQRPLRNRWLRDAKLYYQNRADVGYTAGLGWGTSDLFLNFMSSDYDESETRPEYDFRTWMLSRSIPDALHSRVLLQQPAPRVVTVGAGQAMQERARRKELGIQALFQEHRFWDACERHMLITMVLGHAITKVVPGRTGTDIRISAYCPDVFVVDERAAKNGDPVSMHHIAAEDKLELLDAYPDAAELIDSAQTLVSLRSRREVLVTESIRLPCGTTPGRRVIALEGGVLADEEWKRPRFNACWTRYKDPLQGFYGESMIEDLRGPQKEINYILKELRVNIRKHGTTYYEVSQRSQIAEVDRLDPAHNVVIESPGDGMAGRVVTPAPAHNLVFTLLGLHKQAAYEATGMNEVSATAARPPGLDSGEALREWNAIQSERYSRFYHRYERYVAEAGQLVADAAADIDRRKPSGWNVRLQREEIWEKVPWRELALEEGSYKVVTYPGSSLPFQPPGRAQAVTAAVNAGAPIEPDELLGLLGWHDLSRYTELRLAGVRHLRALFERMIATGEYTPPHPMENPEKGAELATQYWNHYSERGVPEERLNLLSRWRQEAIEIMTGGGEPEGAGGPPPGGPPPAPEQAPPPEAGGGLPPELVAAMMQGAAAGGPPAPREG